MQRRPLLPVDTPPPPPPLVAPTRRALAHDDGGGRWRSRDTAAWITAVAAAWIALLLTALVVGFAVAGVRVVARVQEGADAARAYVEVQRPRAEGKLDEVAALTRLFADAAFSEQNQRAYAAVARRAPELAELIDRALSDESVAAYAAAYARAQLWEGRADAVYNDRRIGIIARAASDVSTIVETRGTEIFGDVEHVLNISRVLVRRASHRIRALDAVLS